MTLSEFFHNQLATWPETAARYADLARVEVRDFGAVSAQYNPARMVSTGAKVDKKTLAQRPCFLCKDHRPEIQQEWAFGNDFDVLVNPFPILPTHFTIAARRHRPQAILDSFATLYELADRFEGTLFFYNGPKCGASAPDHLHFQGGDGSVVPLYRDWRGWRERLREVARLDADNRLCTIEDYPFPTLVLIANDAALAQTLFRRAYAALPCHPDDTEPMLNVLAWRQEERVVTILLPREKHRPACYTAPCEADRMLISPGALDMAGLVITPRKEDFDRLTASLLVKTVGEVALAQEAFAKVLRRLQEPRVAVGITNGPEVAFVLKNAFMVDGTLQTGPQTVRAKDGRILWQDRSYDTLTFAPHSPQSSFTLPEVTIGIGFHWERKEAQTFEGMLRLEADGDRVWVINELPVERYLASVISSEMRATSSPSLLRAHAIISRSWLLTQMAHRINADHPSAATCGGWETEEELVRWYDRDDHQRFDVCADDHCQRYQGITKATSKHVAEAIHATRGQILMDNDEICDARFSKCCGGATEEFQYCWENVKKPYLAAIRDVADASSCGCNNATAAELPDLTVEENAERWIRTAPESFCNTNDKKILSEVLNDYDQETTDFYRWHVTYTQEELKSLITERLKMEFGDILDLVPVERGRSGRICRLKIVGSERTFTIGKELEIRRTLSDTHLYSSAFVVDKEDVKDGVPQTFRLTGAGWGHGVGLCQIGAAVMGAKGYNYDQILLHYYRGAEIKRIYK